MAKRLTDTQKQYIKEHPYEPPRAMANKFGCSAQTIYTYLHRFHGNNFLNGKRHELEQKRNIIRSLYPTHTASEIASILGITKSSVNRIARRSGVSHTKETNERIFKENVASIMRPDSIKKRITSLKRTIRLERFRILSGMEQKTKIHFSKENNKSLRARNYLRRKYNYFYNKEYGELLTLFYDNETNRLPSKKEQHYSDVYHIKFVQADE